MVDVRIYQIYYNQATQPPLDPGFIPLDNTANERPEWYELWPMRNFLNATPLDPQAWYGFVSPKFRGKTGRTAAEVHKLVSAVDDRADVVLITAAWDQLAYFRSAFEQGEFWHPGLIDATRAFLEHEGIGLDPATMVTHSASSVFSNYIVARPAFWRHWLDMANRYYDYAEASPQQNAGMPYMFGQTTPMKTFVQERLPAVILAQHQFRVASRDPPPSHLVGPFFARNAQTAELLRTCDRMKQLYVAKGDPAHLQAYIEARRRIPHRFPPVSGPPRS